MKLDLADPKVKAAIRQGVTVLAAVFSLFAYYKGMDSRDILTVLTLMGSIGGIDLTFMAVNRQK